MKKSIIRWVLILEYFGILLLVIFLIGFYLYTLFGSNPLIIDSTVYLIDFNNLVATQMELHEAIVKYVSDEYLYILTHRHLYKIDLENSEIVDAVPLPFRFNDLTATDTDILLISNNEIVSLNKRHLSFKSGIGIESGDYRPLVKPLGRFLYLFLRGEKKDIIKVFDLKTGRVIRRLRVGHLASIFYARKDNLFLLLEPGKIFLYDINLYQKGSIDLKFNPRNIYKFNQNEILLASDEGIFLVDNKGKLIDFQPKPPAPKIMPNLIFWDSARIIWVDSLTLRTRLVYYPEVEIDELTNVGEKFVIKSANELYLLDQDSTGIKPIRIELWHRRKTPIVKPMGDSLWYIQIGAFSNYDNARRFCDSIIGIGLPAFIDSTDLYRIKLGGFSTKELGISFAIKANILGWFIFQKRVNIAKKEDFWLAGERYLLKDGIIKKGEIDEKDN